MTWKAENREEVVWRGVLCCERITVPVKVSAYSLISCKPFLMVLWSVQFGILALMTAKSCKYSRICNLVWFSRNLPLPSIQVIVLLHPTGLLLDVPEIRYGLWQFGFHRVYCSQHTHRASVYMRTSVGLLLKVPDAVHKTSAHNRWPGTAACWQGVDGASRSNQGEVDFYQLL